MITIRKAEDRGHFKHGWLDTYHTFSFGTGSVIRPGDVQRMTAGTGVSHSEANPSLEEAVHLLQIWILPRQAGLEPGYEQKFFTAEDKQQKLRLIASADGRDGSVTVHQDVNVYATVLDPGQEVVHQLGPNRHAWVQVARGSIVMNGENLDQGDGAAINAEANLSIITGHQAAEVLLFDMA